MNPVRISVFAALSLAVLAASSAFLARVSPPSKASILDGIYN